MARKTWDSLSPAYRGRLERSGITRDQYGSGASLSAARGHAKTPERPQQAEKHPERFREYRESRARIVKEIQEYKKSIWSGAARWNATASRRAIEVNLRTGRIRSMKELRAILKNVRAINESEQEGSEAFYWEGLFDGYPDDDNPLWYH